jgi:hypothetical protein
MNRVNEVVSKSAGAQKLPDAQNVAGLHLLVAVCSVFVCVRTILLVAELPKQRDQEYIEF